MIGRNVNGEFVPLDKLVERGLMTKERYEAQVKANEESEIIKPEEYEYF